MARTLADGALTVLMSLITPLLEKNPAKALAAPGSAFVFSMSRVIVLAFAAAVHPRERELYDDFEKANRHTSSSE